jgi:hypothetical protein
MISQDYKNKTWENKYKKKESLKRKILLPIVGLSALVGSYLTIPQFREKVDDMIGDVQNFYTYSRSVAIEKTVTKDMTNSLRSCGEKNGLRGKKLEKWIEVIMDNNYHRIKLNPEMMGLDMNGNLYPGRKIEWVNP